MWLSLEAREGEAHNLRVPWAFGLRISVLQYKVAFVNRLIDLPPSLTAHRKSMCCSSKGCSSMLKTDTSPVHNPLVVLWIYSALMPKQFAFLKEIASFKLILFIFHRSETIPYFKLLLVCTLTMHLFCQGCCHYFQLSKELPCLYLFWTSWLKNMSLLYVWYGESFPLLQVIVLSDPCWLQFLNITKTLSDVATLNSWQETLKKYYL